MTRVLIVSPFLPPHRGGLETYVEWLHTAMRSAGHEVRLMGCDVRPSDADYLVPARDLRVAGGTSWPLVIPGRQSRRVIVEAVAWADLVVHQNCFWNLTRLASKESARRSKAQFTVVHAAHATYPGAGLTTRISAAAYARFAGRPQLSVAPAIAVSRATQDFLADEYKIPSRYVPCPLPQVPPDVSRSSEPAREPARIAWVGRLVPVKAPLVAVDVLNRLRSVQSVELHVFGGGPLADRLRGHAGVVMRGEMPRDAVLRGIASCDAFLSTSVADNAQIALLEALALGLPCVATSVGEAPNYLQGSLRAGLVPVGDTVAMSSALEEALADRPRSSRDALQRGYELLREHDPARCSNQMLDALALRS